LLPSEAPRNGKQATHAGCRHLSRGRNRQ
jgi:hypothetical protein